MGITLLTCLLILTGFVTNIAADSSEMYHNEDTSVVVNVKRHLKKDELQLEFEITSDETITIDAIKIDDRTIKGNDYRYSHAVGENGQYKFTVSYTRTVLLEKENTENQTIQRQESFDFVVTVDELNQKETEASQTQEDNATDEDESVALSEILDIDAPLDVVVPDSNEVITLQPTARARSVSGGYQFRAAGGHVVTVRSLGIGRAGAKRVIDGYTIWDYRYQDMPAIYVDGKLAYCLEPLIAPARTSNASSISLNDLTTLKVSDVSSRSLTLTEAQKNRITYIANYGYGYDTHTSDLWIWATQRAIWEELGWEVFAPDAPNTDGMVREILNLVATHNDKPRWDNTVLDVKLGETIDLSERIVSQFDIHSTSGLTILEHRGSTLKVRIDSKNASLLLRKKQGIETGTSIVYSDGNSQKVSVFKLYDPLISRIRFEVKSGHLELTKTNNFKEVLSGVTYAFSEHRDMSHPFATHKTDAQGKILIQDIDAEKVIYYRETDTVEGHVLDDTIHGLTIVSGETVRKAHTNIAIEGQAKLIKTDGHRKLLEGVVFGIYKQDGTLVEEKTTDVNGEILTSKLRYGDYYFKEHQALYEYWPDATHIPFEIREHDEVKHLTMANTLIEVHVEWQKTNEDGEALKGVGFKIRNTKTGEFVTLAHADGKHIIQEDTWFTDAKGEVFIKGLIGAGEYELVEVLPLDGYQTIDPITFSVDADQTYIDFGTLVGLSLDVGEIVNYHKRGHLKITKLDMDTKAPLPGFGFNLYDIQNNLLGYYETGDDGTVTIENLKYGVYTVEEIKVNGEYGIDPQKARQDVFIETHGETYELTFENKRSDIKTSVSFVSRDPKAPHMVTLRDRVSYTDLQVGQTYTVTGFLNDKDTGAPILIDGQKIEGSTTFTPTEKDGFVDVDFTFDARRVSATRIVVFETLWRGDQEVVVHHDINDIDQTINILTYRILKKDIGTKEILKDAEFTRWDQDGNVIEVKRTDENGIVEFKLFQGEINTAKETDAPLGYLLSEEIVTMDTTVHEDGTLFEIEYFNTPKPAVMLPSTGVDNTTLLFALPLTLFGMFLVIVAIIKKRQTSTAFSTSTPSFNGTSKFYEQFIHDKPSKENSYVVGKTSRGVEKRYDVKIIGNLAANPELTKYGEGEDDVCSFATLAVSRRSNRDRVDWVEFVVYGKLARDLTKYKKKGDTILVEGEIQSYKKDKMTEQGFVGNRIVYLKNVSSNEAKPNTVETSKEEKEEFKKPTLIEKAAGFFK